MPIEVIELGKDGTYTTMPEPDSGISTTSPEAAPPPADGLPAVNVESAPTPVPAAGEERLAAAPEPAEADTDEPDAPAETPITAGYVNRKISRLTARYRNTEKELLATREEWDRDSAVKQAQIDTLTKMLSGAAPPLPDAPPQPTGPPQAEQFERHEDFVHAAATYATDQRMQQERQQQQQVRFQQDLMSREQTFKAEHPDFDTVVRGGLAGKVSPVLQQALMLVPDGPAVAYTLAQQPDLVQRLNSLPPPLVLVELGRLSHSATPPVSPAGGEGSKGVRNEGAGGNGAAPSSLTPSLPSSPLPEPMAPVGGGGSNVQPTYTDSMNQREFEAWRARTSNLPYLRRS